MEKIFYPESMVIIGLSSRAGNIPRMILENLLRWGYRGKIFGLNPRSEDTYVDGIKMYKNIDDLPQVPDLAVCLVPARFVPEQVDLCGKFGVKRMAIPSGGFSEFSEEGRRLSELTLTNARKYGLRFVGPNGLTVANRANGLCLLFIPLYSPPPGEISIISQSGGFGLAIWGPFTDENLGMAKFASVGNKLDLDEVDFLEYFGKDPATKIIFMYLEGIKRGKELIEAAKAIDKPIIVLKANITSAGSKAAMSHTAALSNDEDVMDAAFERVGIIRIHAIRDFIAMAKAFKLPPVRGNRVMVMGPAGGFAVTTADLCAQAGFEFADPGEDFYQSLQNFSNAGVIRFSNPLDTGDIYDPKFTAHIIFSIMHNEQSDCVLYVSPCPHIPAGDDVFSRMLRTDLSKEIWGAISSSGKPVGVCFPGMDTTIIQIKKNVNFPVFNSPEEMVRAMAAQRDFYARKAAGPVPAAPSSSINRAAAQKWITAHHGVSGESTLNLLSLYGIPVAESFAAHDESEAISLAEKIGYPVVMKVVSPDAIHKSEAQGVMVDIKNSEEGKKAFLMIKKNLSAYKTGADFQGVRVQKMASDGYDMFIGGKYDAAFGPVVYFGFGGIYVEVFKDISLALCPSSSEEIEAKVKKLKAYTMLKGFRSKPSGAIQGYIDSIVRVARLLYDFPQIKELDMNPLRILSDGSGVVALDARIKIE